MLARFRRNLIRNIAKNIGGLACVLGLGLGHAVGVVIWAPIWNLCIFRLDRFLSNRSHAIANNSRRATSRYILKIDKVIKINLRLPYGITQSKALRCWSRECWNKLESLLIHWILFIRVLTYTSTMASNRRRNRLPCARSTNCSRTLM